MTDPILTDDEKGALLEGMSSGEIEVHSNNGPTYAAVTPFEIGPRARIVTKSYPRLQNLNQQFASLMSKQAESLLNAEATVAFGEVATCSYSEFCERNEALALVIEFSAKPLDGSGLISVDGATVGSIVETFYGGLGNEPARQDPQSFTPGELSIATLFGESVLAAIGEVWHPVAGLEPKLVGTHLSSGVIDKVDGGDPIISSEFTLDISGEQYVFQVLWPTATVTTLLPMFEGQKRDRDAAEDARWERSIRARVTDSVVNISSVVGEARSTLGAIADLAPGDVINISNPRKGKVLARDVPVLAGRFGVHDGRYAIETTAWLDAESNA